MRFFRFATLVSVLTAFLASMAAADHPIPKSFKIPNLKVEGNKCKQSAFDEDFWSKGKRGERTSVEQLTRVCGTTRIEFKGLRVNINWVDGNGRAYTDCERFEGKPMQCWLTFPEH
jgi:hypothetical protein